MQQHYNTLGLSYGASKEEIKKAFHKLAHIHHPDKGGKLEDFLKVKNAYDALMAANISGGDPAPFGSQNQEWTVVTTDFFYDIYQQESKTYEAVRTYWEAQQQSAQKIYDQMMRDHQEIFQGTLIKNDGGKLFVFINGDWKPM